MPFYYYYSYSTSNQSCSEALCCGEADANPTPRFSAATPWSAPAPVHQRVDRALEKHCRCSTARLDPRWVPLQAAKGEARLTVRGTNTAAVWDESTPSHEINN